MGLLLLYLSIALFFSFLCSLLEATLLSVTPSYVGIMLKEGKMVGRDLQSFKENVDRPLAAILTLNTFAHTIGAAGVGAQAQLIWGEESLTLVAGLLTIVILVLTEIIPKTLGANYWRELTPFTVKTLKVLIYSPLYPIIVFCQFITRRLKKDKERSVLSRADFTAMAEIGMKAGIFRDEESKIITNLLRLNKLQARDIMTPRTVVAAAPEAMTAEEFYRQFGDQSFSRIPVFRETIDQVQGYVLKGEVLSELVKGNQQIPLRDICRPILAVPPFMPIPDLFNKLTKAKNHLALVVDEYGGTNGVVSMEDIVETLLGLEIMDEVDKVEDMQQYARQRWEKRFGDNTPS
ncbi:CNNM domain-containing protein [soil metagenome]